MNDIKADLHDVDTVYAAFDNHKTGDFKPYVMKSTDRGRTWDSIVGDLPDRHLIWRLVQDHEKKDLLFLGTECGLFFTLDGGTKWIKLTGGVPTIPFRDIEIQQRENDLVGASFGRGFFVLDDYAPLRGVSDALLKENELVIFPVRKSLLYIPARVLGGEKGSQGDGFYTAPNPPFGAVFTYYLRDTLKTRKQIRHEREAKVKAKRGDNIYPGWEKIKQEDREEDPVITFTIKDTEGRVVNRVTGPTAAGIHRVSWNLRYPAFTAEGRRGPLVTPGVYTLSASQRVDNVETPLGEAQTFEVVAIGSPTLPVQDREEVFAFQMKVGELQRAAVGASGKAQEVLRQLIQMKQVIKQTQKADMSLLEEARNLELKLLDAREALTGDPTKTSRSEASPPSMMRRIQNALGSVNSTYGPTKTQQTEFEIARQEYDEIIGTLNVLIDTDFAQFQRKLDAAGIPWTSGRRIPELKD